MYMSAIVNEDCDCHKSKGLGQYEAIIMAFADWYMKEGNGEGGTESSSSSAGTSSGSSAARPGAMPSDSPTTVNPTTQIQVSPQISPVFQQSYMPSNSAMNAGTSQTSSAPQSSTQLPTATSRPGSPLYPQPWPAPGATPLEPNFADPLGGASYLLPTAVKNMYAPEPSTTEKILPWAIGGIVLTAGLAVFLKGKKRVSFSR